MELDINFADVPDKVLPIDPGVHIGTIESIELKEATPSKKPGSRGLGERFEFTLKITEGPMSGRKIFDSFQIEFLRDTKSPAAVKLGHMIRSAGLPMKSGINTDELKGKSVRFEVTHRNYVDDSNVTQTAHNLKDYIYSA